MTTSFRLLLLSAVLLLLPNVAAAKVLRVGTCTRDITPITPSLASTFESRFGIPAVVNHTDPINMAGFGNGRNATDYHDRLWARGLVVDGTGGRIAIVTLDVVGYFTNEIQTARAMISPASAIDYAIITSTHQHEGPDTLGLWGPDALTTGIDFGYLDFVNAAIADCIDEAAANLQRARVRFATTTSEGLSLGTDPEDDGMGVADGKVLAGDEALSPATEGRIVDPTLAIMQFTADAKPVVPLVTLVNFASHPESLGSSNQSITADFPHFARERLESELGGLAIWVSGDLGVLQGPLDLDVEDPLTMLPATRRTFRWSEVYGTALADRAGQAIDVQKKGHPTARIRFASTNPVAIPLDNPFFRFLVAAGVLNERRSLFTNGTPDHTVGFPFPEPFDVIPQALGEDIHTEVGALRIGRGSFALVPSELDPQIGFGYRGLMHGADHTFIFGLANDHIGYQVPFAKWDPSCHQCAPFILAEVPELCPVQPIDCNTVFENNVGQQVDPRITDALTPLLESLR